MRSIGFLIVLAKVAFWIWLRLRAISEAILDDAAAEAASSEFGSFGQICAIVVAIILLCAIAYGMGLQ